MNKTDLHSSLLFLMIKLEEAKGDQMADKNFVAALTEVLRYFRDNGELKKAYELQKDSLADIANSPWVKLVMGMFTSKMQEDKVDARESYESSVQEYKEKEKKLDEKEKALEADFLDKGKAYKRQLEADYKTYKNQAGRLPLIYKNAKEALSLLNANRFFKPKGVESILAQIIQKCEQ